MTTPANPTPEPDGKARRKRMLFRVLSSLNVFVVGALAVQMYREPKVITAIVMLVCVAAIYRLDKEADAINSIP